jgi:putative methyltransferase (TIGR04325 family)
MSLSKRGGTSNYKEILKWLLPPFATEALRRLRRWTDAPRQPPEWQYIAEHWPAVDPRSEGWLHDSIASTQQAKWPEFHRRLQGTSPLGVAHEARIATSFDHSAHNTTISFAYVLARAAHGRETLSVLDWGGGLGHYALIARAVLPEVAFDYTVHDLPANCAAGRQLLPEVQFSADEGATFDRGYDLVFASSSLQYARDWGELLGKLARAAGRWLYLTRLPTVSAAPSFVVVQRPKVYGYDTEYLSWVFNRGELLRHARSSGMVLAREFLVDESPELAGAPEQCEGRGLLFRSPGVYEVRPTHHFDERP